MPWNLKTVWDLVHFHQMRGKLFSFPELYRLTKNTPSNLSSELKTKVDPYFYLTQSGKGYNYLLEKFTKFYSNPEATNVKKSCFGLDTPIHTFQNKIYQPPQESYSFWKLYQAAGYLHNISKLPGVKKVYVFGSTLQGCSTKFSDVDIAIQTVEDMAVATRIMVKLYLKLANKDVYSIWFSLVKICLLLVYKLKLINLVRYKNLLGSLHAKTWQYKLRPGLKIDAGMYFSDIKQLQKVYFKPNEHFFMYDVRQFNFYKKGRVLIPYFTAPSNIFSSSPASFADNCFKIILYLPALLYLWWQNFQNSNPNHIVGQNWISFVPTVPEPKYLFKLN